MLTNHSTRTDTIKLCQPVNSNAGPQSMPIPSTNFSAVMLLCEIDLQCKTIARAGERLRECAQHWVALSQGIDDGKTAPPIDIVAWCSVCLSASASIRRLLSLAGRRRKKASVIRIRKRCETLMDALGNPDIPVMLSAVVRNSWEHLDERLDELLSTQSFKSFSEIHVAVKPPDTQTFVLRHFDPVKLEIKHCQDAIPLEPLIAEAGELSRRISEAFNRLKVESCDVY